MKNYFWLGLQMFVHKIHTGTFASLLILIIRELLLIGVGFNKQSTIIKDMLNSHELANP
jgi:hypothetical protein